MDFTSLDLDKQGRLDCPLDTWNSGIGRKITVDHMEFTWKVSTMFHMESNFLFTQTPAGMGNTVSNIDHIEFT